MRVHEPRGALIDMGLQGDPCWYVRGHVSLDEAREAVHEWWAEERDDDGTSPELGPLRHCWGRWRPVREGDYGLDDDCTHVWVTRSTPAPGWARVTEVWDAAAWRCREETRAVEYAARALVQRRWPAAEIRRVNAWPWAERAQVTVQFRLAGLDVKWGPWRADRSVWISPVRRSEWVSLVALRMRWAEHGGAA